MEMRCFGIGAEKCDREPTFGRNCDLQSSHNALQFALLTDLLDVQIDINNQNENENEKKYRIDIVLTSLEIFR
jgi:hypothetical protein